LNAKSAYYYLDSAEKVNDLEKEILKIFPDGSFAAEEFLRAYTKTFNDSNITEQSITLERISYKQRFKDSSKISMNYFDYKFLNYLRRNNDWAGFLRFQEREKNKLLLAGVLNSTAWSLSGKTIENAGSNLDIAESFAKQAIDIFSDSLKVAPPEEAVSINLLGQYCLAVNTYALVLYKKGDFDAAFNYQNTIYQLSQKYLSEDGMTRLAVYAEKAKGATYAKELLEKEILSGRTSPAMLNQLRSIYKSMNIAENEVDSFFAKNTSVFRKRATEMVLSKYGSLKAKEFTLESIDGKMVSLSQLKNKIVILDFWASWCGPCRAAFPDMQQLVNKYSADTNVVFVFIDVWEKGTKEKIKEQAKLIIEEGRHTFNVLLDYKDEVRKSYKIESIPETIVIDKLGDILLISADKSNISVAIEVAKNIK
jgi:thiol-disulfide isomerase/thioredoxin